MDKRTFATEGQISIWRESINTHPKRFIFRSAHLGSKKDNIWSLVMFYGTPGRYSSTSSVSLNRHPSP